MRALLTCVLLFPLTAAAYETEIRASAGLEEQSRGEWRPLERRTAVGIETTTRHSTWSMGVATDAFYRFGSRNVSDGWGGRMRFESSALEVAAGPRFTWQLGGITPSFGGGLSLVDVRTRTKVFGEGGDDDGEGASDSAFDMGYGGRRHATSFGVWAGAGLSTSLGRAVTLGVNVRALTAPTNFGAQRVEAGGLSYGAVLGMRFGGGDSRTELVKSDSE